MIPTPSISILLSVFNAEKTLDTCFESIANQSFQDFVLLCIDDASTDGSAEIISRWQKKFGVQLISLTNEQNLGLTRSLNKGLAHINTPYTARIDSDDWWHPLKLQKQVAYLSLHPNCGLLGTHYQNVFKYSSKDITPPIQDAEIKKGIFGYNPFAHSAVIFKTSLVQKIQGYNETVYYGQDYDLWLRLLPLTEFANIPEVLCYRSADAGISTTHQNEQLKQYMRTQWKYLRKYKYPLTAYGNLLRPLLVVSAPQWIKKMKRFLMT